VAHRTAQAPLLGYEAQFRSYLEGPLIHQEKPPQLPDRQTADAVVSFIEEVRGFAGVAGPSRLRHTASP
jgi:hypothetical protein